MFRKATQRPKSSYKNSFSSNLVILALLLVVLIAVAGSVYSGMNGSGQSAGTDSTGSLPSGTAAGPLTTDVAALQAEINEARQQIASQKTDLSAMKEQQASLLAGLLSEAEKAEQLAQARQILYQEIIGRCQAAGLTCQVNAETGNLNFGSLLTFASSDSSLTDVSKAAWRKIVPIIVDCVFSDTWQASLNQIQIVGYADDGGTYTTNLTLSQTRAETALLMIINENLYEKAAVDDPQSYFAVSGCSNSRPIKSNGTVNKDLSRRLEINLQLNDEGLLSGLQALKQHIQEQNNP
ncbi:MAG: OmpA family protein [Clostridiaceae bacterium]|nr:OmpA family protein [Clostridiaceae bacterium]